MRVTFTFFEAGFVAKIGLENEKNIVHIKMSCSCHFDLIMPRQPKLKSWQPVF